MKLQSNVYHVNKQSCLEEGSRAYETTNADCNSYDERENSSYGRCFQLMNLILYLELILFIGWMGGVFITNYYQALDPSALEEKYRASEWSWDPESFDHSMDSSYVAPDASEGDGEKTTTTKNRATELVTAKKIVTREMETTEAMNGSAPDDTEWASILPWLWLKSLAALKNTWTDDSSESTSSKNESHWETNETATSTGSDLLATDQDDIIDLDYLATLPLWSNVDCTLNYLDKRLDSDRDLLQADGITNAIIMLKTIDSPRRHRSRRTRSTSTTNEDSSLSSRSGKSISIYSELLPASSEATSKDEYPATVVRNRGNVIDTSKDVVKYMGNNLVDWVKEEGA